MTGIMTPPVHLHHFRFETNKTLSGIQTHDPSVRDVQDPRLTRPRIDCLISTWLLGSRNVFENRTK